MLTLKHFFTAAGVLCASVLAANAATYNFNMVVVESNDTVPSPTFDLPDVGSTGTVSILLDGATLDADGDPLTNVNFDPFPLNQSLADASASFSGAQTLTSDLPGVNVFSFNGGSRFSDGSFSNIVISLTGANCPALACTLAGSYQVLVPFAPPATTFSEVEAQLANPAAKVVFSFNGTVQGEFVSFRAESTGPAADVPLPASGLLLLGAFGAVVVLRRRKASN